MNLVPDLAGYATTRANTPISAFSSSSRRGTGISNKTMDNPVTHSPQDDPAASFGGGLTLASLPTPEDAAWADEAIEKRYIRTDGSTVWGQHQHADHETDDHVGATARRDEQRR